MEWKPANRDRFSPAYDKGAAAVLTFSTEDGGRKNHAMVVICSEDIDRAAYVIYSRALAKYLNSINFKDSTHHIDILRCVVDSFNRHVGKDGYRVWTYHPMYDIDACWCINIMPTSSMRTFMETIEDEVERHKIITYDTAELLAILETNAESEVGINADMGGKR